MKRYWICFDLGLQGDYTALYTWLDEQDYKTPGDRLGAKECCDNVATFVSNKTRDQITRELETVLGNQRNPRIYVISMKQGGKFVFGKRKFSPWKGYGELESDTGDET